MAEVAVVTIEVVVMAEVAVVTIEVVVMAAIVAVVARAVVIAKILTASHNRQVVVGLHVALTRPLRARTTTSPTRSQ